MEAAKCTESPESDFVTFFGVWAFCFCFDRLRIWLLGGKNIIVLFWKGVLVSVSFLKIDLDIKIWCLLKKKWITMFSLKL